MKERQGPENTLTSPVNVPDFSIYEDLLLTFHHGDVIEEAPGGVHVGNTHDHPCR